MSFVFYEQDAYTLLYEERVSPWTRAFIAGVGLTMMSGTVSCMALFASSPFPSFSAAFYLFGSVLFTVLGVFLIRLGWLGPASNIRFDDREKAFVYTEYVPLGQFRESRHPYREVADIRVKPHIFEGSLEDYSIEIRMKDGKAIACGFWSQRSDALVWAERLKSSLLPGT